MDQKYFWDLLIGDTYMFSIISIEIAWLQHKKLPVEPYFCVEKPKVVYVDWKDSVFYQVV